MNVEQAAGAGYAAQEALIALIKLLVDKQMIGEEEIAEMISARAKSLAEGDELPHPLNSETAFFLIRIALNFGPQGEPPPDAATGAVVVPLRRR